MESGPDTTIPSHEAHLGDSLAKTLKQVLDKGIFPIRVEHSSLTDAGITILYNKEQIQEIAQMELTKLEGLYKSVMRKAETKEDKEHYTRRYEDKKAAYEVLLV